ncbi:hypothetical protein JL722_14925 [Aureococcus anophagefferens]|nr:hypothetical protein JL722_14925 [Aureococcus anophagefferens]
MEDNVNEDYAPSETCSTTSRQSLAGFRAGFMSHGDPSKKPAAKSLGPKKVKSGGIKSKFLSGGASRPRARGPPTAGDSSDESSSDEESEDAAEDEEESEDAAAAAEDEEESEDAAAAAEDEESRRTPPPPPPPPRRRAAAAEPEWRTEGPTDARMEAWVRDHARAGDSDTVKEVYGAFAGRFGVELTKARRKWVKRVVTDTLLAMDSQSQSQSQRLSQSLGHSDDEEEDEEGGGRG